MTDKLIDTEMTRAEDNPQQRARHSARLHTLTFRPRQHEPESSTSASKSKGKGKSKAEDYDDAIGDPENIEDEIAAIKRQIDDLKERQSELQGIALLDKLEELHKQIHDLVKAVPETSTQQERRGSGRREI